MKYFTRRRYRAIQQDSRTAERDWRKASADYARQLRTIRDELPESGRELCGLTLHDGVVRSVRRTRHKAVVVVDATNNPWGPRGKFELLFTGVQTFAMRGRVMGDWWLYEEVHPSTAGFALHVLLQRSSLIVAASGFSVRKQSAAG
jgi:hypothetical protein